MSAPFSLQRYVERMENLLSTARITESAQQEIMQILLEIELDVGYIEERRSLIEKEFSKSLEAIESLNAIIDGKVPLPLPPPSKPSTYLSFPQIGIGSSRIEGNGVFAIEKIEKNQVIEVVPVIICPRDALNKTPLIDYYFNVEDESNSMCAVALGWGSVYNHSDTPSAHWILDPVGRTMAFIATRSIEPEEEITISYGSSYWSTLHRKGTKRKKLEE